MRASNFVVPFMVLAVSACGQSNSGAKTVAEPQIKVEESKQDRWLRENAKDLQNLKEATDRIKREN